MYQYDNAAENNALNPFAENQIAISDDPYFSGIPMQQQNLAMVGTSSPLVDEKPQVQVLPVYLMDEDIQPLDMPDPMVRRDFFRRVFIVLLMQNFITIPVVEVFTMLPFNPFLLHAYFILSLITFGTFIALYHWREARRHAPMNWMALALITILLALQDGIYGIVINSEVALVSPTIIIIQIIGMIYLSRQNFIKFNMMNAILVIVVEFIVYCAIIYYSLRVPFGACGITFASALTVIYYVYDMQLMLSGYHAYNLQPDEFIYAAVNIYADLPLLYWRFVKYHVIDPFVRMYRFLANCCSAEVC